MRKTVPYVLFAVSLCALFAACAAAGADVWLIGCCLLYTSKAKKVFATDDPALVIVDYKDDATAGDGAKKGTIRGKGVVNNKLSNNLMQMLAEKGVPTHFVEELSDRETLVKKVEIVPLEVIVRNVAAGSFTKRLGVPEGTVLKVPTLEMCIRDRSRRGSRPSWPSRCTRP